MTISVEENNKRRREDVRISTSDKLMLKMMRKLT